MKAMILAAGRGERMRPLTLTTPKPLLKANGRCLIEYHLDALARAGIQDVIVNHSWLGDQIVDYLGDGRRYGVSITYSDEGKTPLETAGGINHALPLIGEAPFLVVNADIWTDYDFVQLPANPDQLAYLILVDNPPHHPEGDFALDSHILKDEGRRLTYSGIGIYHPELFRGLDDGPQPLAPILRTAIARGEVGGDYYHGHWWDIGTPQRLQQLDDFLRHAQEN